MICIALVEKIINIPIFILANFLPVVFLLLGMITKDVLKVVSLVTEYLHCNFVYAVLGVSIGYNLVLLYGISLKQCFLIHHRW